MIFAGQFPALPSPAPPPPCSHSAPVLCSWVTLFLSALRPGAGKEHRVDTSFGGEGRVAGGDGLETAAPHTSRQGNDDFFSSAPSRPNHVTPLAPVGEARSSHGVRSPSAALSTPCDGIEDSIGVGGQKPSRDMSGNPFGPRHRWASMSGIRI